MSDLGEIIDSVAVWRDPEHTLPFFKGRIALYAILRTLGIGDGDEVVVPGFTCVVVPAAILYRGATPVYHDIDTATLHGDPDRAIEAITERTRAIIVQHNFGSIAPLGGLLEECRQRGIAIIEDCAHSIGAHRAGVPVGTLGTAAFCSLQWSKPTTTGLGGIARFNDADLMRIARGIYDEEFREPSRLKSLYLNFLSTFFRRYYRPSWYWTAQDFYRWAGKRGLIQGSSSAVELETCAMPPDYRERFGALRAGSLDTALAGLPRLLTHRRWIAELYRVQLENIGIGGTWRDDTDVHGAALRFPLLVDNREELLWQARKEKIEIGDWFNAPLHPGQSSPETFGYTPGCCPRAEFVASRIINLPTHRHVDENTVRRSLDFLARHANFTIGNGMTDTQPRANATHRPPSDRRP
jgi:dTDP-4-amino-4,6-dideoxygalactose transaminase